MDLIDKLLATLNLPAQPDIDDAWAEETERRISLIERGEVELIPGEVELIPGEVELIPGEVVFEKIRRKYRS